MVKLIPNYSGSSKYLFRHPKEGATYAYVLIDDVHSSVEI